MNAVAGCLRAVPQAHLDLTVVPLVREDAGRPGHLLLDYAVRRRTS